MFISFLQIFYALMSQTEVCHRSEAKEGYCTNIDCFTHDTVKTIEPIERSIFLRPFF